MVVAVGLAVLWLASSEVSLTSAFLHLGSTKGLSTYSGAPVGRDHLAGSNEARAKVVMMGKGRRKKDVNYEEILGTGEKEEGMWPSSMTPWEAQLGPFEPLLFDPEDFEDEEEPLMLPVAEDDEEEDEDYDDEDGMAWRAEEGPIDMSMVPEEELNVTMELPASLKESAMQSLEDILMERSLRFYEHYDGAREKEKCFLVGISTKSRRKMAEEGTAAGAKAELLAGSPYGSSSRQSDEDSDDESSDDEWANEVVDATFNMKESLTELSELVGTAGLEVAGSTCQRVHDFNSRTCLGSGKVREIKNAMASLNCKTLIIDEDLTPSQQMNLENAFGGEKAGIKVLDRTALILDIFAQHAKTKEGKLQVELALHMYRLPRLTRLWTHLERQSSGGATGSVGLRGPGESQLESDKRIIRKKISTLKKELLQLHRHRSLHRMRREKSGYPVVALVGYTNSGKSTLLNSLTRAGALAEDLMFATLDPTTRKLSLPQFQGSFPEILLTDTVGFIQKLPTHLVAAFRATLEEIFMADVIVHLVDVSNPLWRKQKAAVDQTLEDMGVADKPTIVMLNKVDAVQDREAVESAAAGKSLTVVGSAVTGEGFLNLLQALDKALRQIMVRVEVIVPFSAGDILSMIHDRGCCDKVVYQTDGTYVVAKVPQDVAMKLLPYRVDDGAKAYKSMDRGAEIDWVALAKGRHDYVTKVKRGEVISL